MSAVGSDNVSAWAQSDIGLRPAEKIYIGLGGTGQHTQVQDDRHERPPRGKAATNKWTTDYTDGTDEDVSIREIHAIRGKISSCDCVILTDCAVLKLHRGNSLIMIWSWVRHKGLGR
jgi:hypothetical protein